MGSRLSFLTPSSHWENYIDLESPSSYCLTSHPPLSAWLLQSKFTHAVSLLFLICSLRTTTICLLLSPLHWRGLSKVNCDLSIALTRNFSPGPICLSQHFTVLITGALKPCLPGSFWPFSAWFPGSSSCVQSLVVNISQGSGLNFILFF